MALTTDQVRKVAHLARLSLTEAEVEKYAIQLSNILNYMEILNEIDTTKVEATAQVTGLKNVERVDEVAAPLSGVRREELLSCTNLEIENNQIKVKSVF